MNIMKPTKVRENFYSILKQVNDDHKPIIISDNNSDTDAVLISKAKWDSISETLNLENADVMNKVRERENDDSEWVNIDEINWDEL